jgi:hypothetical protein
VKRSKTRKRQAKRPKPNPTAHRTAPRSDWLRRAVNMLLKMRVPARNVPPWFFQAALRGYYYAAWTELAALEKRPEAHYLPNLSGLNPTRRLQFFEAFAHGVRCYVTGCRRRRLAGQTNRTPVILAMLSAPDEVNALRNATELDQWLQRKFPGVECTPKRAQHIARELGLSGPPGKPPRK